MAGETTSASSTKAVRQLAGSGSTSYTWTLTYSTTQNETNDVMEAGYLPAGVTVIGFIYSPSDMDTNGSPALVQKITVGSTDVATGLTGGQSGTKSFVAINPIATTAKTLVKVTSTTAAATAAAGTVYLTPVYYTT